MTITIYYRDGSTEEFTGVTGYQNDGQVIQFDGTDASGVEAGWEIMCSDVRKVKKVTP